MLVLSMTLCSESSLVVEADGTDLLAECGSVRVVVPVSASSVEFGRIPCLSDECM
jgi:hypothetical protein